MGAVPTVRFSVSIRPTQAARLERISESLNGSYSAFADLSISAAFWQVSFVRRERPTQRASEREPRLSGSASLCPEGTAEAEVCAHGRAGQSARAESRLDC